MWTSVQPWRMSGPLLGPLLEPIAVVQAGVTLELSSELSLELSLGPLLGLVAQVALLAVFVGPVVMVHQVVVVVPELPPLLQLLCRLPVRWAR